MELLQVLCTSMTLIFADVPYTVQMIPKGDCLFCCKIIHDDIKLYFFRNENRQIHAGFFNAEDWDKSSWLNDNKTIVIYIHGFTEQAKGPAATLVKDAYMKRNREYFIAVDWQALAAAPWYDHAVTNTHHVAVYVANFIDNLVLKAGVSLDRIHVIGFSLGAEIAGLVGKLVRTGKLARITGLDPAYPLYSIHDARGRIDKGDARFVDIIHTDGGELGFFVPLGHADFYPNGGKPLQPGCKLKHVLRTGRFTDIVLPTDPALPTLLDFTNGYVACSHNRAWKYYAESVISPYDFPAVPCPSYKLYKQGKCHGIRQDIIPYMGMMADPRLRGNFFLETDSTEPYGGERFIEGNSLISYLS